MPASSDPQLPLPLRSRPWLALPVAAALFLPLDAGAADVAAPVDAGSVSGSLELGGTADTQAVPDGSGSLDLGGSGVPSGQGSGAGSLTLGGTSTPAASASGSGSLVLGGGGSTAIVSVSSPGSLTLGGTGTARAVPTGAGSVTLGGTAQPTVTAATAGSIVLSGAGAVRAPSDGTGSLTLGGTAAASAVAVSTGSVTLGGAPSAVAMPSGAGSLTLVGTGSVTFTATGAGSITLGGTGTARARPTGAGSITLGGTAAGVKLGVLKVYDGTTWKNIGCGGTGPSPVTFIATYGNADNSGGGITVTGIDYAAGDVLMCSIAAGGGAVYSAPTGWTALQTTNLGFGGTLITMYRVAATAGVAQSFGFTGSNTFPAWAQISVYRYALAPTLSGKVETTTPPTLTAPTLTATGDGILYVAYQWATNILGGTPTTTLPSGMTPRGTRHMTSSYAVEFDTLDKNVSAGATGDQLATAGGTLAQGLTGHSAFLPASGLGATTGRLKLWDGTQWVREACTSDTVDSRTYPTAPNSVRVYADDAGTVTAFANQLTSPLTRILDVVQSGGLDMYLDYQSGDITGGHSIFSNAGIFGSISGTTINNVFMRKADLTFLGSSTASPTTFQYGVTPPAARPLYVWTGTAWDKVACLVPA